MSSPRKSDPILDPWEVLESRDIYSSPPWLAVAVEKVRLPDGKIIEGYHHLRMPHYVVMVAQTDDNRIIFLHQYKHGFRRACLTLPGGLVEQEESPESSARRELLEETGYTADRWTSLASLIPHSNYECGRAHLFLARGLKKIAEPASGDLEEAHVVFVPEVELVERIRKGDIVSLSTVAALGLARMRRE